MSEPFDAMTDDEFEVALAREVYWRTGSISLDEIVHGHAVTNPGVLRLPNPHVLAVDGFTISVQAGLGMHCSPGGMRDYFRPGAPPWPKYGEVAPTVAEYEEVECGMPSERPEPWSAWSLFCDDPEHPTATVYGYVPVGLVRLLLDLHGGEQIRPTP